jgi:hypothetical protein
MQNAKLTVKQSIYLVAQYVSATNYKVHVLLWPGVKCPKVNTVLLLNEVYLLLTFMKETCIVIGKTKWTNYHIETMDTFRPLSGWI